MTTNTTPFPLSKLDASMVRSGVVFGIGYRFQGEIDKKQMQKTVNDVVGSVERFKSNIVWDDKYRARCEPYKHEHELFRIEEVGCLEKTLTTAYQDIGPTGNPEKYPAMCFVLFIDQQAPDNFLLVQFGRHSHCDGYAADSMYNHVINHYNAGLEGDEKTQQKIITELKSLTSPSAEKVYGLRGKKSEKLISIGRRKHIKNCIDLMSYKINDKAQHSTSYKDLPEQLDSYCKTPGVPQMRNYNIENLLEYRKKHCPKISLPNMVRGIISKAIYRINCEKKGLKDSHNISFRSVLNIFNSRFRKKYIGNYMAYVPITVDATLPLHQLATDIHERLYTIRRRRQDVSMYKLLEFALGSGMANKSCDPISYIHTDIRNAALDHPSGFLKGAQYRQFESFANAKPIDFGGAQINNCPTICTSVTGNELSIFFFTTIIDPQAYTLLLDTVDQILSEEIV